MQDLFYLFIFYLCVPSPIFNTRKGPSAAAGTDTLRRSHQRRSKTQSTGEQPVRIYHHQQAVCNGDAAENSQRLSLPFKTGVKPSATDGDAAPTPRAHIMLAINRMNVPAAASSAR